MTAVLLSEYAGDAEVAKYYGQRHRLWSKADAGVMMTPHGWCTVALEQIANHVADRCHASVVAAAVAGGAGAAGDEAAVVDAFCGCGGNTIAFARRFRRVIGIDNDPEAIRAARHNAALYGVADRITFITADLYAMTAADVAALGAISMVHLSPPWGGPNYLFAPFFDVADAAVLDGAACYRLAARFSPNTAVYLPRHTVADQLRVAIAGSGSGVDAARLEAEGHLVNDRVKAVTWYTGTLAAAAAPPRDPLWSTHRPPFTTDDAAVVAIPLVPRGLLAAHRKQPHVKRGRS
jgi:trimethylguanosine synthase